MKLTDDEKKLFRPLLWDTNADELDIRKHKKFLIERMTMFGFPQHIRWMLNTFSREEIIQCLTNSKVMDKKTANYWSIRFHIDKSRFLCFSKPSAANWQGL